MILCPRCNKRQVPVTGKCLYCETHYCFCPTCKNIPHNQLDRICLFCGDTLISNSIRQFTRNTDHQDERVPPNQRSPIPDDVDRIEEQSNEKKSFSLWHKKEKADKDREPAEDSLEPRPRSPILDDIDRIEEQSNEKSRFSFFPKRKDRDKKWEHAEDRVDSVPRSFDGCEEENEDKPRKAGKPITIKIIVTILAIAFFGLVAFYVWHNNSVKITNWMAKPIVLVFLNNKTITTNPQNISEANPANTPQKPISIPTPESQPEIHETPKTIDRLLISDINSITTDTQALITCATNDNSTLEVNFGITDQYEKGTINDDGNTIDHNILIEKLDPGQTYYYQLTATNKSGLKAIVKNLTFQTKPLYNGFIVEGNPAPDFILEYLNGKYFILNDKPKKTLINFWSTECKPCVRELPFIQETWNTYSTAENTTILTVNLGDSPQAISDFFDNNSNCFTFEKVAETSLSPTNKVALISGYGIESENLTRPIITNGGGPTDILGTSATLRCKLVSTGNDHTDSVRIYWGDIDGNTDGDRWTNKIDLGNIEPGVYESTISNLASGKIYYYRCCAVNSIGAQTGWSPNTASFIAGESQSPYAPQIINDPGATHITRSTAMLNGELTWDGGEINTIFVYWGGTDGGKEPSKWDNIRRVSENHQGTISYPVDNLTQGDAYFYRFYAENSRGSAWAPGTESFIADDQSLLVGLPSDKSVGILPGNRVYYSKFTAHSSGYLGEIHLVCSSQGHVRAAIYSDNASALGSLLFANNTGLEISPGPNIIPLPGVGIKTGATYWLAVISDTDCIKYMETGGVTQYKEIRYRKYDFPVLMDRSGNLANKYKVSVTPMTFFLDNNGIIKNIQWGQFASSQAILDMLNSY